MHLQPIHLYKFIFNRFIHLLSFNFLFVYWPTKLTPSSTILKWAILHHAVQPNHVNIFSFDSFEFILHFKTCRWRDKKAEMYLQVEPSSSEIFTIVIRCCKAKYSLVSPILNLSWPKSIRWYRLYIPDRYNSGADWNWNYSGYDIMRTTKTYGG